MQYSLTAIGGSPREQDYIRTQNIGFVSDLARISPFHALMPLGTWMRMLNPAIDANQIQLYFGEGGECVGYVIWAYLAPDVERRFFLGKDLSLHATEWKEGCSLWIVDFLIHRKSLPYVIKDMQNKLFKSNDSITYYRRNNGRYTIKRLSRRAGGNVLTKTEVVVS
jgi:hemolysin-activating ACP:hemolysin acyltransferase